MGDGEWGAGMLDRRSRWQRSFDAVVGWLGALALRALGRTWRVCFEGPDPFAGSQPQIAAFWHRNLLVASYLFRNRGVTAFVSRSRDGDLITGALSHLGYARPARGSSSRGGAAALREMVRLVRKGLTAAVVTDGPRGPARRSKPGVLTLARLTAAPIAPLAFSARPCLRLRSWDRTLLPLPFARVICHFAAPIAVKRDLTREAEDRRRRALDRELNQVTDALDLRLGLGAVN
jgi:lysophospholipid acyltransferase (LPLAT)-like uncharacterized protein